MENYRHISIKTAERIRRAVRGGNTDPGVHVYCEVVYEELLLPTPFEDFF